MELAALIPAYSPAEPLIKLVQELSSSAFSAIVVVNDGSRPECEKIFHEISQLPKVSTVCHATNLGKGAALKTGLNYAYCKYPNVIGVVTIDADGQHLVKDALMVADSLRQHPNSVVIGVRAFNKDVPLRSMFGNQLTKKLFRFLVGQHLTDTQSGLRGIPRGFIGKLLKIDSRGYEFELDMLLACKYSNTPIVEREITTVYLDGNQSSHFNPIFDSMKIYFVLFRFMLASLATALIDYTIFIITHGMTSSLVSSQVAARGIAMMFNYTAVKKAVFYSDQKHSSTFPKYALLVLVCGSLSLLLINIITSFTTLNILSAKMVSELLIFLANFAVQRDFIFTKSTKNALH